jgi:hypothetical protein
VAIIFTDGPSAISYACYDAGNLRSECHRLGLDTSWWWGLPNSFTIPRGEGPGFGYILLTKKELNSINLQSYNHYLTFRTSTPANLADVRVDYICIVDAKAIAPSSSSTSLTNMYLVRLADSRHLAGISTTLKNYNVQAPGFITEEGNNKGDPIYYKLTKKERSDQMGYDPWTWQQILTDLWEDISPSGTTSVMGADLPDFHTGATQPPIQTSKDPIKSIYPENYFFAGTSTWKCFNRVLYDGGHTFEVHPDGTYKLATLSQTDDVITARRTAIQGTYLLDTTHGIVGTGRTRYPEYIEVAFPLRNWSFHTSEDVQHVTPQDAYLTGHHYILQKETRLLHDNILATDVVSGTTATIHTSYIAARKYLDTDGEEVLANEQALKDIRDFLVQRYVDEIYKDSIIHETYSGFHDFYAGSVLAYVYYADTGAGPITTISSSPVDENPFNSDPAPTSLSIPNLHHPNSTFADGYKQSFYWMNERAKFHYPFHRDIFIRIDDSTIPLNEKGNARVVYGYEDSDGVLQWENVEDDATPPDTGTVNRIVTILNLTGAALNSGDTVYRAVWDWQLNCWFILPQVTNEVTILRGLTKAQVTAANDFDIDNVEALTGSYDNNEFLGVKNSSEFRWEAYPEVPAYVLVGNDGEGYPLQVRCPTTN